MNAQAVVAELGSLEGVEVRDTVITPREPPDGKYGGQTIPAVRLVVTERRVYDPVAVAIHLLAAIRAAQPAAFEFREAHFDRLAGGPALRARLLAGDRPAAVVGGWRAELADFEARRGAYLLYR